MKMMMMIKFVMLTTLVVFSPISIFANDLMIRECHNAQVPTICMQCLESDPNSSSADPVGIAAIIIHCLESHLQILTSNITKLSTDKEISEAVKTVLEVCKKDMTEATTKLTDAKTYLENGDYDTTNHLITLALDFPLSCSDDLQIVEAEFSIINSQIAIYAQLTDAAMRIIDRF